jgi:hypothetical protein
MTTARLRNPSSLCAAAFLLAAAGCGGSDLTSPTLGGLQVTVETSGNPADLDPDGYTATMDGGGGQALPTAGSVTFSQVTVGIHTVSLSGVASNCTLVGQNPVSVTVTAGATAQAAFQVACAPPPVLTGGLEVTAATSGNAADLDPDGYTVAVDGGAGQPVAVNGSVTFTQLAPGTHTVALSGIASNCTVSGEDPVVDTVSAGTTAQTTFQITCAPPPTPPALSGHIAFVRDADIYVMRADGSGVTRLTNTETAVEQQPAWSPSGAKIAFVSNRDGNDEIYVMNTDGTGVTRLTDNPAADGAPAWSPDGTKIAFQSDRDGLLKIYVMKANGAGVTLLTKTLFSQCTHVTPYCPAARSPAWSPNGAKIAFAHRFGDFGAASLDVMNADGSGITRITGAGFTHRVSWSRTGKIAFDAYSGNNEIFVVKPDGTGLIQLTHNTATDDEPSWSPDGTSIAFVSNRAGTFEIYAMNANGSGVTQLTQSGGLDPAWGP